MNKGVGFLKKLIITAIIMFSILISGCNYYQVESMRKTREIIIDGNDEDWIDAKYYIKDHDVVFGVMNDNEFLYLCFYPTTNELTRQVLSKGLTLWINNDGKKKKKYGIRFPMGLQGFMVKQISEEKVDLIRNKNKKKNRMDPQKIERMVKSITKELEIIGPEKDKKKIIKFADLNGMEIGIDFEIDLLAFELKIPLANNADFTASIGADPTSKIALGFEIPRPNKDAMKGEMKEMEGIDDRPSDGLSDSGRGMGKGGMQGDSSKEIMKSKQGLDIWTTIQLVEN